MFTLTLLAAIQASACPGQPGDAFHALAGAWRGAVDPAHGEALEIAWYGWLLPDRCTMAGYLDGPGGREFVSWQYRVDLQRWVEFSVGDPPSLIFNYMSSQTGGEGAVFIPEPGLMVEAGRVDPGHEETGPALRRSRWTTFTADELVVEIDTRESGLDEWVPAAVMRMEKRD